MNINGVETQSQNYAAYGVSSTKSGSSESTLDSFQKEIVNWQKRVKAALEKQQENDKNGNLEMSEKQWHNLMKKVDSAIGTLTDDNKEQAQKTKKQSEAKNLIPQDTVATSFQTAKTNFQFIDQALVQTSVYAPFLPAKGKRA